MKIRPAVIILACSLSLGFSQPVTARSLPGANANARKVDLLFSDWEKSNSPGAAIAIIKDGTTVYAHGYGMANLEYGIKNTPSTVFHVASDSKQFTAFAIYLLAGEGKLSLDDDVRKYLPELHDFGKTITIRNLLHHTSGLRDQWDLLTYAGWRMEDVITQQDVLNLIWRQRELNFAPGDQYEYSNTNFTLLGLIVARLSGISLPQFAKKYIFEPLGMRNTHFQDDYHTVVKDRAYSYSRQPGGGYGYVALSFSTTGPSSLFTTVEDMAKWDQNFYDTRVGSKALLAEMQARGRLNNGKEINYASGLIIDSYRGLPTVWHNGGDAGYRANILRFPDQHFSVVILGNAADMNPTALALKVADIYLNGLFKTPPPQPAQHSEPRIKISPALLDGYAGDYQERPDYVLSFTNENGTMMVKGTGSPKTPTFALSDNTISWGNGTAKFAFDKPVNGNEVLGGVVSRNGVDIPAKKLHLIPLTQDQLDDYAGDYYSGELGVLFKVSVKHGRLIIQYSKGEDHLSHSIADVFEGDGMIGVLHFTKDQNGRCDGFSVNWDRVQNLRFVKVTLPQTK